MSIKPVILCGGSGTRLWPESRKRFPKQFITLHKGKSLFDLTLKRLKAFKYQEPIIITSKNQSFLVKESLNPYG